MKILIAEDDENSRLLLESILLSIGHAVLIAPDGNKARQLLETETPDLIITDILMPGLDGFDLCRFIRRQPRLKDVPIIVYSATYIDRKDEELARAVGANRFIVKPIEPLAMIRLVEEMAAARPTPIAALPDKELDALHIERLQAKLRRKLIQLGRERSALRASEERLRLAMGAAALGVIDWSVDTDQIQADAYVNQLVTGNPGRLAMPMARFRELIHPDDRNEFDAACKRLTGSVMPVSQACRFTRPDGRDGWMEIHARRIPQESFSAPLHVVGIVKDATRERSFEDRLRQTITEYEHRSRHDPLTSLPNRLKFNDLLDNAIRTGGAETSGFALLLMDLDAFQVINDSLGHAMGDALLVMLADRITRSLRPGDLVARLGGDEFAVIARDVASTEEAIPVARKLLEALGQPNNLNDELVSITVSVGISLFPRDGQDRHALLKAADTAMFDAKAQGRNRYSFHTEQMALRANELHTIEQGLKRALEQQQLFLHYQPQVNIRDGRVTGVEALIRWQHPQEGLIPPDRFIPIAESTGLIEHVGRWVLRAACAEVAGWSTAGSPLCLSVNVSAKQLTNDAFIDNLVATLDETGFPAGRLELELTESTLQLLETSPRLLEDIKRLGVRISIDDFGTGYSSLSVLKNLPIDRLKIDRSFVRDMPEDRNDIAIVEAIIGLSRTLKLDVVAEGVETEAQLAILEGLGCAQAQGYHFSRPVTPEVLQQWVRARMGESA